MIRADTRTLLLALPLLAFTALAVLLVASVLDEGGDDLPSVHVNQPAPGLDLLALEGYPIATDDDLVTPGIKLVNFWASWCAPCRVEHPNLMLLAETGLKLYGVNYKDDPDHARDFLESLGSPFARQGADPRGRTAINWGVYGIPETFLVDGDGRILLRHAGPITTRTLKGTIMPAIEESLAAAGD